MRQPFEEGDAFAGKDDIPAAARFARVDEEMAGLIIEVRRAERQQLAHTASGKKCAHDELSKGGRCSREERLDLIATKDTRPRLVNARIGPNTSPGSVTFDPVIAPGKIESAFRVVRMPLARSFALRSASPSFM
jgi:hypothetical protein